MLWRVVPERIEFWQGRPDRDHVRLVYRWRDRAWTHDLVRAEMSIDIEEER
jgi:pyridoxamine 5'-phosphate oxidase